MGSSIRRFTGLTTCSDLPPWFSLLPCPQLPWRTLLTWRLPRPNSRLPSTWLRLENTFSWPRSTTMSRPSPLPSSTLLTPRTWLLPRLSSRLPLMMLLPEVLLPSRLLLQFTLFPLPVNYAVSSYAAYPYLAHPYSYAYGAYPYAYNYGAYPYAHHYGAYTYGMPYTYPVLAAPAEVKSE